MSGKGGKGFMDEFGEYLAGGSGEPVFGLDGVVSQSGLDAGKFDELVREATPLCFIHGAALQAVTFNDGGVLFMMLAPTHPVDLDSDDPPEHARENSMLVCLLMDENNLQGIYTLFRNAVQAHQRFRSGN